MDPDYLRVLNSRIGHLPELVSDRYETQIKLLQDTVSHPVQDKFGVRLNEPGLHGRIELFWSHPGSCEQSRMLLKCVEDGDVITLQRYIVQGIAQHPVFENRTLLMYAALLGRVGIMQLLMRHGWSVDDVDEDGITALCCAVMNNNIHAIQLLLSCNANINQVMQKGWNPLMMACNYGHILAIFELLSHSNVDITWVDDDGKGALHESVEFIYEHHGSTQSMLLLLILGAPLNERTTDFAGVTPLQLACSHYAEDACTMLVSFGANPNMLSSGGYNVIDIMLDGFMAFRKEDEHTCRILTILMDIRPDMDISSRNSCGQTPAMNTARTMVDGSFKETFKLLCKYGADLTIADPQGLTVLHILAAFAPIEIIQFVLEELSKISVYSDMEDMDGITPESVAQYASENRSFELDQIINPVRVTAIGPIAEPEFEDTEDEDDDISDDESVEEEITPERAETLVFQRDDAIRVERERLGDIAKLIHQYSRASVINEWNKRTRGGLRHYSHERAHLHRSVTYNNSPIGGAMHRVEPGQQNASPYPGDLDDKNPSGLSQFL